MIALRRLRASCSNIPCERGSRGIYAVQADAFSYSITSFKTAWIKVRQKAGVKGRWHDNRNTLVTELSESGAGDEVIMSIAGHVSRAMLSRYSHVRMEAKRRALDEIAARQNAADAKRKEEAA